MEGIESRIPICKACVQPIELSSWLTTPSFHRLALILSSQLLSETRVLPVPTL